MQVTCEKTPARTRSRWLVRSGEKPKANIRLFCFPYAGGSTNIYRSWQGLLPETIDVAPVLLPGRGECLSEAPFVRLSEIVEVAAHELAPYFEEPFAFFGHSMGALIGQELTRWLRRNNRMMPAHLFVSARRAPQMPELIEPTYDLPEPEFIERLRQLNGTPQEVLGHPELMQLMIPLLRADFAVCETYRHKPEPPLDCPITVFGGVGDVEVPAAHLSPWRELTSAAYQLHLFPGDHFFIHTAQAEITRTIAKELDL